MEQITKPEWPENITFITDWEEPKCEPNPEYPSGIDVDATSGGPGIWVDLPYPAPCCGTWVVSHMGKDYACTAAGRPDDPKRIKVPTGPIH